MKITWYDGIINNNALKSKFVDSFIKKATIVYNNTNEDNKYDTRIKLRNTLRLVLATDYFEEYYDNNRIIEAINEFYHFVNRD